MTRTLSPVLRMVTSILSTEQKELLKYKAVHREKKDILWRQEQEILEIMSDECSEEECVQEVEETEAISMDISGMVLEIEEKLAVSASPGHATLDGSHCQRIMEARRLKQNCLK